MPYVNDERADNWGNFAHLCHLSYFLVITDFRRVKRLSYKRKKASKQIFRGGRDRFVQAENYRYYYTPTFYLSLPDCRVRTL